MANKKYKVKNTNLLHNGKLYKLGDFIELDEKQAKKLSDVLTLVSTVENKTNKSSSKTKSETVEQKSKNETEVDNNGK